MGLGKGFWDMLKPVGRMESLESLRGKVLAVDLSFWMIQLLSSVKGIPLRKPHLRLLFFRTIHLVAKIGAYPVFVADGDPPPLKLQVRLDRFSRISGIQLDSSAGGADSSRARNNHFLENIEECVELLELLGVPVLRAKHEAEGLCAELEKEGLVHACLTPDSDAFLYGARHVIKNLQADLKDPHMESYMMRDIESFLGLHREHLIALALLAGCDYNAHGVSGIGYQNAIRLIKDVPKEQIFDRLRDWGNGKHGSGTEMRESDCGLRSCYDHETEQVEEENRNMQKKFHCSFCGHLGTKKLHNKLGCQYCRLNHGSNDCVGEQGCQPKVQGFKCTCQYCKEREVMKKYAKQICWQVKVCEKISATKGFPNEEIIQIFMNPEHDILGVEASAKIALAWKHPKLEALESFLEGHLHWGKAYVRQKVLPLLSYYCLREKASMRSSAPSHSINPTINGLYVPHSIQRIKILFSKPLYRLRWTLTTKNVDDWLGLNLNNSSQEKRSSDELDVMVSDLETERLDNNLMFTTDEDMMLLKEAYPDIVLEFEKGQDARKNIKRGNSRGKKIQDTSVKEQIRITSFFKSRKEGNIADVEDPCRASSKTAISEGVITSLVGKIAQSQVQGNDISTKIINYSMKYQCKKTVEKEEHNDTPKSNIPIIHVEDNDDDEDRSDKHELNVPAKFERNVLICEKRGSCKVSKMPNIIYIDDGENDERLYPCKASKLGGHSPRSQISKKCSSSSPKTPSDEASQCMYDTIYVDAATTPRTCLNSPNLLRDNKVGSQVFENRHQLTQVHARRLLF